MPLPACIFKVGIRLTIGQSFAPQRQSGNRCRISLVGVCSLWLLTSQRSRTGVWWWPTSSCKSLPIIQSTCNITSSSVYDGRRPPFSTIEGISKVSQGVFMMTDFSCALLLIILSSQRITTTISPPLFTIKRSLRGREDRLELSNTSKDQHWLQSYGQQFDDVKPQC